MTGSGNAARRLRCFMDGRVHAYEVTALGWRVFSKDDRVRIGGQSRRVWGFDAARDVIYVW